MLFFISSMLIGLLLILIASLAPSTIDVTNRELIINAGIGVMSFSGFIFFIGFFTLLSKQKK